MSSLSGILKWNLIQNPNPYSVTSGTILSGTGTSIYGLLSGLVGISPVSTIVVVFFHKLANSESDNDQQLSESSVIQTNGSPISPWNDSPT